ncbi:MAG: hypothetical protein RXR08_12900 [Sulfolobaceae archaeon]
MSTFVVRRVTVPVSDKYHLGLRLRQFQYELKEAVEKNEKVVLSTPTGSGKTFSLLLSRHSVGLYPVLELLNDQYRSLTSLFDNQGLIPVKRGDNYTIYDVNNEVVGIFKVSQTLCKGKLDECVPDIKVDRKVVLTTPDTFHLYNELLAKPGYVALSLMSGTSELRVGSVTRREIVDKLKHFVGLFKGDLVFVDEFHLYDPYQLRSLIITLKILKKIHDHEFSLVLSSATPSKENVEIVERELAYKFKEIRAVGGGGDVVRGDTKVEVIEVEAKGKTKLSRFVSAGDAVPGLIREGLLDRVYEKLKAEKLKGIIVVDKVGQALEVAKAIYERFSIRPVCKTSIVGDFCGDDDTFVVGSSAITQGVDYPNVYYGLIARFFGEAAIQAFGRVGRKMKECEVHLVVPKGGVKKVSLGEISYDEFVEWVRENYPKISEVKVGEGVDSFREELLVNSAVLVYKRLTGHQLGFEKLPDKRYYLGDVDSLKLLYYFRYTGPSVRYKFGGSEGEADLSTVMRNFSFEVKGDVFYLSLGGRKGVVAKCSQNALKNLVGMVVSKRFLEEMLGCSFEDEDGNQLRLGDQLFLVLKDVNYCDRLVSMARAIGVKNDDEYCLVFY